MFILLTTDYGVMYAVIYSVMYGVMYGLIYGEHSIYTVGKSALKKFHISPVGVLPVSLRDSGGGELSSNASSRSSYLSGESLGAITLRLYAYLVLLCALLLL